MKRISDMLDAATEQLLLDKSFEELTASERASLAERLTAEEYGQMRQTLLSAKSLFKQELSESAPVVSSRLRQALANKRADQRANHWWMSLLSYRVPAWQVAMSFAAMLIYFVFPWAKPEPTVVYEPAVIYKTDTVYKDRPVYVSATRSEEETIETIATPKPKSKPIVSAPVKRMVNAPVEKTNTVMDTIQLVVNEIKSVLPEVVPVPSMIPAATGVQKIFAMSDTSVILKETFKVIPAVLSGGRSIRKETAIMEFFTEMN